MGHRRKLGGSLVLTLALIACAVISYSFAWYKIQFDPATSAIQSFTRYFYWTKSSIHNSNNGDWTEAEYDSDSDKNVKAVFTTSLTFLTVGAGVGVLTAIFQIVGIIGKSRFFRIFAAIAALVSAGLLAISFFTFFKITKAFEEDNYCAGEEVVNFFTGDEGELYCNKFQGSKDGTLGDFTFGPYVGWYILIGGIVFGFLSSVTSFLA